jgi:hypothetical protein
MDNVTFTNNNGTEEWRLNGVLHRLDGPAVILDDDTEIWYYKGEVHRENGPAYIDPIGYKAWYINGKRHRTDGPAIIYNNGEQEWWIDGVELNEQEISAVKNHQLLFGLTVPSDIKKRRLLTFKYMGSIFGP